MNSTVRIALCSLALMLVACTNAPTPSPADAHPTDTQTTDTQTTDTQTADTPTADTQHTDAQTMEAATDATVAPEVIDLPARTTLRGVLEDTVTGLLPTGVTLRVDDAAVPVSADGAFSVAVARGQHTLTASAAGYATRVDTVYAAEGSMPVRFGLGLAGVPRSVGASGGRVETGGPELSVPPGAFTAATDVSAQWIASTWLPASEDPGVFREADAQVAVLGRLSFTASRALSVAASLYVPRVAGVDPSRIALYRRNPDGSWGAPSSPNASTDTAMTFSLSSAGEYALAERAIEAAGDVWVVTEVIGDARAEGNPLQVGSVVLQGSLVQTGCGAEVKLRHTDGRIATTVGLGPSSALRLVRPTDTLTAYVLNLLYGRLRAVVKRALGAVGAPTVEVRTPVRAMGIRGTEFEVSSNEVSDELLVHDGTISVGDATVEAGQRYVSCPRCTPPLDLCDRSRCVEGATQCAQSTPPRVVLRCVGGTYVEQPQCAYICQSGACIGQCYPGALGMCTGNCRPDPVTGAIHGCWQRICGRNAQWTASNQECPQV